MSTIDTCGRRGRRRRALLLLDHQGERWFAELQRRRLERVVFCSLDELTAALEDWNTTARPCTWTKTADRIFAPLGMATASAGNSPGGTGMARGYSAGEPVPSFDLATIGLGAVPDPEANPPSEGLLQPGTLEAALAAAAGLPADATFQTCGTPSPAPLSPRVCRFPRYHAGSGIQ